MSPKPYKYKHAAAQGGEELERKTAACWLSLLLRPAVNEKGSTIVIAILMLALLTYLGIAALNTATTEIRISGNDKVYKQAFYNSEAGISYALERGFSLFPAAPPGALTNLAAQPAGLAPEITLQYIDKGGPPRRVEIRSTGTSPGGGRSVVIAGMVGIVLNPQNPQGTGLQYNK